MDIVSNIGEGVLGGESYMLTLENEGLALEFDADYELGEELMTLADETVAGIIAGDITPLGGDMDDEMHEDDMDAEDHEDDEDSD